MSCNTCFTACTLHPCYDNLWIGKATANNRYRLVITNLGSGRIVAETVTANSGGFFRISGGTWNDFFNSSSLFKFQLYQVDYSESPNVTSNIPVDFYPITGFTGGYDNVTLEAGSTTYDCAYAGFEMLYDGDGEPIELDNQYLFNEDA